MNSLLIIIGLEVHVQLNTKSKLFCCCSTNYQPDRPNTQVCPICLGHPGTLPVLNKKAFEYGLKAALAFHCKPQPYTRWDRKNYFYPDVPKNYQITQYDFPFCTEGKVILKNNREIALERIHLEEDSGKLLHQPKRTIVDLNRAGIPLLEIVSKPVIHSAKEAKLYLDRLKQTIQYLEISECSMEKGSLRCDLNISLQPPEAPLLSGTRVEVKNLNSFSGVTRAILYESKRQTALLKSGKKVLPETRHYLEDQKDQEGQLGITRAGRQKMTLAEYRFFPEPDLPPIYLKNQAPLLTQIKQSLPELPAQKQKRFEQCFQLDSYTIEVLIQEKRFAEFFESLLHLVNKRDSKIDRLSWSKLIANLMLNEIKTVLNEYKISIDEFPLKKEVLVELLSQLKEKNYNRTQFKEIFQLLLKKYYLESEHWTVTQAKFFLKIQEEIKDSSKLETLVEQLLKANPQLVEDYKKKGKPVLNYLYGCIKKETQGRANYHRTMEILEKRFQQPKTK